MLQIMRKCDENDSKIFITTEQLRLNKKVKIREKSQKLICTTLLINILPHQILLPRMTFLLGVLRMF